MLDVIDYNDIRRKKRFLTLDLNTNSKLYQDNDTLYKILYFPSETLKEKLEYIDELNLEELIKLKSLIYKKGKLVGYSFEKYNDYKSLNQSKRKSIKEKLEDCKSIILAFDNLSKNNLIYTDYHLGNVLVDLNNNIKICDLDNTFISDVDLNKNRQLKNSLYLCLSYLYGVSFEYVKKVINCKVDINQDMFYKKLLEVNDECSALYLTEILNSLDLSLINIYKTKKIIKEKGKELDNRGYYNRGI